ncbi:MAG: phosphoribosylformylglycinamidine synthase I [Rectinemataceae bacterium]|jgi:phosphoribosylformylglycinamidine synthase
MMKPKALVLHAPGSNRDPDVCTALSLAGADPEIVHLNLLRAKERRWEDYSILVLPGGFSYADALGAGRLLALDLASYFADEVSAFVGAGKPVIGICNGFQALVKSGILSGGTGKIARRETLTHNERGRFECRWVRLAPVSKTCLWTKGLTRDLFCPVAHGEGRFVVDSDATLAELRDKDRIAFVYARADGSPAGGGYPDNPNGSIADIAGICNEAGNVLGLMPHPENNVIPGRQVRTLPGASVSGGLELFRGGVLYAAGE